MAAAAIDMALPLLAAVAVVAAGLLTPAVAVVLVGWTLYYFFVLESDEGQTLGKRAMGLRVMSADGRRATMRQVATRTLVRVADGHIVGLIAMLASGERRQRLGDLAAGTVVTEANSPAVQGAAVEPAKPEVPAEASGRAKRRIAMPRIANPKLSLKMPKLSLRIPNPTLSLPKLPGRGRRASRPEAPVAPAAVEPTATAPMRAAEVGFPPPVEPTTPLLKRFDPATNDAPEPNVEITQEEPDLGQHPEPDPMAGLPQREVEPVVEVMRDEPEPDPEPEPEVTVKPIDTISAIDLVMQDAEQREPPPRPPSEPA